MQLYYTQTDNYAEAKYYDGTSLVFNYKNIKKNSAAASKSVVENFEDSWNAYQIEDSWNANPLQTIGILIVLFVIIKFLFFKH